MLRRQSRRQDDAVVVAVRHDQRADKPRRNAPRRRPSERFLALLIEEFDLLGPGKILPEEVRRAGLQRFAVLHHGFDAVGVHRAGKAFAGRLFAFDDRHGHVVLREGRVDVEHAERFFDGFLLGGVGRVAFLPEKLGRAQKQPRAQFPADDVGPLVDQDRQIAIRLHPFGIHGADDRFAGRPHDQRLFELAGGHQPAVRRRFEPMMRDDGAFLGKALDVGRLFFQIAQRNEERKIGVLMARVLEHLVEHALHVFPDAHSPTA